jgi:hypothetical protein
VNDALDAFGDDSEATLEAVSTANKKLDSAKEHLAALESKIGIAVASLDHHYASELLQMQAVSSLAPGMLKITGDIYLHIRAGATHSCQKLTILPSCCTKAVARACRFS